MHMKRQRLHIATRRFLHERCMQHVHMYVSIHARTHIHIHTHICLVAALCGNCKAASPQLHIRAQIYFQTHIQMSCCCCICTLAWIYLLICCICNSHTRPTLQSHQIRNVSDYVASIHLRLQKTYFGLTNCGASGKNPCSRIFLSFIINSNSVFTSGLLVTN